jgi:hypothetical protein
VWAGVNAQSQADFHPGEIDESEGYWLWRRIADGAGAKTRRITGEVDIDDPGCPLDQTFSRDQRASGPCYGPLAVAEGVNYSPIRVKLPAISANGRRIAFLTKAESRGFLASTPNYDVFVTDMTEGVTRKQGTIELTREVPDTGAVLPIPALIGPPASTSGQAEIYVVDLERLEMERAVRGLDGSEVDGDATGTGLSLSADGSALAYNSNARNLFVGDLNNLPDAFVTRRLPDNSSAQPVDERVAALGESRAGNATVKKRLTLGVDRMGNGRLRMRVHVPEAGLLSVRATASVPAPRRRAGRARTRTLGHARANARAAGTQTVVLRLSQRYLARITARKQKPIRGRLFVNFVPAARGETLRLERLFALKR